MAKTDPTSKSGPTPAPVPRRRLRRVVWGVLIIVCVLFAGVSYLTRPAGLGKRVTRFLEESIGCRVHVGPCALTWGGILTVQGVDLSIPGELGEAAKLFHADRVTLGIRLAPLLLGQVRASTVAIDSPTLYLTENLDDGRFNYQKLISLPAGIDPHGDLPVVLPEVFLQNGKVRFGRIDSGGYEETEAMSLAGTLIRDPVQQGAYQFFLNQNDKASVVTADPGPSILGRIDLDVPMLEVRVDRFEFQGPHRYLLTQAMRNWWDRLSPEGALPRVVFSVALDEQDQAVMTAEVSLDGIGLSLPIEDGQPLRMTGVSGEVSLTNGVVELTELTGEVEGITFKGYGLIDGFEADAPFEVTVTTQPFDVPAEGGLWDKMPPAVRKYQTRFSPQGRYQAQVTIHKSTRESRLRFRGYLDLLDTRFSYHKFPYPAKQLTGRITFDNQQVRLNDLVGIGPSGGRAVVSGTIAPPSGDAKVDITIRGEQMPVDHHLTDAMKPKHRKMIDMFFDHQGYEDLVEKGVIRSPDGDGPDSVPEFALGGSASMVVRIQKPAGKDRQYRVTTDIEVAGLRSLFQFWHYPVFADGGRVRISPEHVEVDGVRLRGVHGGGGIIDGRLTLPGDDRLLAPSLQLKSIRLPIDEVLIASIPPPKDAWVRSLKLTGELVGTGEIYATDDGQVAFTVDSRLIDAAATPNDGDYTLENIQGQVTVERTRVQIEDLTATHGEGTLTLYGQTDWGEDGVGVELTFMGDHLRVQRGLTYLLPPGHEARALLLGLFEDYRPDGRFDAVLKYHGGGEGPDLFTLDLDPQTFSFDHKDQRIELTDLTGGVLLTPKSAVLQGIAGAFPAGTFKINGEILFESKPDMDLTFEVYAGRIDPTARALLPDAARSVVDRLSLQGPYQLTDASLLTQPDDQGGSSMIFQGKVRLDDAQANVGVPVSELDATLDIYLVKTSEEAWPSTDIRIQADQLRAADRLIKRCSLSLETGEHPWLIKLRDLQGSVYGGALVGDGELRLGEPGEFSFDLTIQEAALEPFLHPLDVQPVSAQDGIDDMPTRNMVSGLLSASLSITAPLSAPQDRRGRGVVLVRDAKLYDRPLTLALLQAANFALPNESSFDRASAHYLIFGDTVRFDDIRFEAPAFVIAGAGIMDYPSTQLQLRMVTHNPTAPDLGPISSLVRTFKDELLGIEVTGTLAEPTARVVPLAGLFKSVDRVFGDPSAPLSDGPSSELQPSTP